MKQHKDQRYITALLKNDRIVLKEIYQKYAAQIHAWVRQNNGSTADAKDIFQEGLIAIYTKAAQEKLELTAPFGALLMRICKNKWIDQLRKKKRSPEVRISDDMRLEDNTSTQNLSETVAQAELQDQILAKTFAQLSDLCRQLLNFLVEGISPAKVAIRLEMSNANTVYRRKKACTDRWRALYTDAAKKTDLGTVKE